MHSRCYAIYIHRGTGYWYPAIDRGTIDTGTAWPIPAIEVPGDGAAAASAAVWPQKYYHVYNTVKYPPPAFVLAEKCAHPAFVLAEKCARRGLVCAQAAAKSSSTATPKSPHPALVSESRSPRAVAEQHGHAATAAAAMAPPPPPSTSPRSACRYPVHRDTDEHGSRASSRDRQGREYDTEVVSANSTLWVMGGMCGIVGTALTFVLTSRRWPPPIRTIPRPAEVVRRV